MEAEAQLRDRLKSIVETEGSTVVEPACLSDESLPVLESAFRGACDPSRIVRPPTLDPESAPKWVAPKGWMFILAGIAVGVILAIVCFLTCRKRPVEDANKRSGRREGGRPSARRVEEDSDDELEDEDDEPLPAIAKAKPSAEAHRPSPKRATRARTETEEDEDPMFQPL